jgi:hypothetical protein
MDQNMEWKQFEGKLFISDLGLDREGVDQCGDRMTVGRFAVWSPISNCERHQVIEVGSDLAALQRKYDITDDAVLRLVTQEE